MKINILSLLVLCSIFAFSCKKACDKDKFCDIKDCFVCDDKMYGDKDKDDYCLWDELGNKIEYSAISEDAHGKYFTDDQGNNLFFGSDANGDYYTDLNGDKIYLKGKGTYHKDVEKYILSPLIVDDECGYIVKGKIKYVVNGQTSSIVDYGDGTIDAWAVKTIYLKKDYKKHGSKGWDKDCTYTKCCKFEQKCKEEVTDSAEEDVEISY